MPLLLTPAQVEAYRRDGFLPPVAAHHRAYPCYRAGHKEQMALHDAAA